ncbi:MAG: DUF3179 domain-containing protein [Gemmatimonadetes bacterium]|nr:DUF3179 domain-containing protein [Gemmatimonadota bacterium]
MKPRNHRFFNAITLLSVALVACNEAESQDAGSADVPFSTRGWETDFSIHSVPLDEIMSGGPPKDGIPAIDRPRFVSVNEADEWIGDREPVILFEHDGEVRGYPWQILMWHEIVNDEVAGLPVAVTYCPLCNTAIAFDRRLDGRVLDFGTTGKLRHSDLVMYDRQTETWWQQATGEAIVGQRTGETLTFLSAPTVSWEDFKREYPDARVLSRETGYDRPYGRNPYEGYDRGRPFLYRGPRDDRLPMMERVVVVKVDDDAVAFPLGTLADERAINHRVGDVPVVLFHRPGTASAVDADRIAQGRDIGAATAYLRTVDGRTLTFVPDGDAFQDEETGTRWNLLGAAVSGPLEGKTLEPAVHYIPFWFAWAAFAPETPVYGQE